MGVRNGGSNGVMRFRTGLVVGKFCPLHKGHEYLIDRAQASCDRLILISYTKPEFLNCEVETRRVWLKALYPDTIRLVVDDAWLAENQPSGEFKAVPHNDADDLTHRRFTAWLCHHVLGETIDVIFTSESYGDGFAQVVSDIQSTPVEHICVDMERINVPISGSHIRENLDQLRPFLSDVVYASFVKKAVFLGGESTGKSTLSRRLAEQLETEFVAEYGRELWEQKKGVLVYEDMLHIVQTQIDRETTLTLRANAWLFCDTSPLTTAFYSNAMFETVAPELEILSQRPYDVTFLCAPDFEFVQDGTREGADFRDRQHEWYVQTLSDRQIDFIELTGPVEDRVQAVLERISLKA